MAYRRNVCAVLTDPPTGRVLVFRRADNLLGTDRWQFPQGGVRPGESARQALLRELEEEIGTNRIEILAEGPTPIRYDFPPGVAERLAAGDPEKAGFHGQEQTWFLARLIEGEEAIHFRHEPREFDAWRWVSPREAIRLVVPFKAAAYEAGLRALGLLPQARA